jgi:hypothetical protein
MGISAEHIEFIRLVANGSEQDKAYMVTIGNNKVTGATARSKGSALAKKYAQEIVKAKDLNKSIVDQVNKDTISKVAKGSIISAVERMEILTKIAKGEIPLKKHMVCDGVIEEVEVVPDWMDRKNAIAELNKMDGSYAATKADLTIKDESTFYLPKEDDGDKRKK